MTINKVSIIIPTYNRAHLIIESLESVKLQTYSNWECIIIDDHSQDNTKEVISQYIKSDPRFKYKLNIKKGACAARNLGISLSEGNFIQFLDSDDVISDTKLDEQVKKLNESSKSSIAFCGWIKFEKNKTQDYKPQAIDKNYSDPLKWLIDSWNGGGMSIPACWLIPKDVLCKSGNWNENLIKNQDGEFITRVICNSTNIQFIHNVFAYYRKPSNDNLSMAKSKEAAISQLESYKLNEYILKFEDSTLVNKALAQNYSNFIYNEYSKNKDLVKLALNHLNALNQRLDINFPNRIINLISKLTGSLFILKIKGFINRN